MNKQTQTNDIEEMFQKKLMALSDLRPGHYGLIRTLKHSEIIAIHERTLYEKNKEIGKKFGYYTPLLFHGTRFSNAHRIIQDGVIKPLSENKGITSLTDLDFTQMERMRVKNFDLAFGFHREELRKHYPSLNQAFTFNQQIKKQFQAAQTELNSHSELTATRALLKMLNQYHPTTDVQIDMHEYRVTENIDINRSLWILIAPQHFTKSTLNKTGQAIIEAYSQKFGGIAYSKWDEAHQTEFLQEPQYAIFTFKKNCNRLIKLRETGEYYVKSDLTAHPLFELISTDQKAHTPIIDSRNEYNLQRGPHSTTKYIYEGYSNTEIKRFDKTEETFEIHAWPLSHYQLARTQYYILKNYAANLLDLFEYQRLIDYPENHSTYEKIKSEIEKN